jgi:outer membrane protein OmpA-like peptidoglycan-associated protein
VSTQVESVLRNLGAKKVGAEIQISLSGDVLFDFDKSDIRPEAEEMLQRLAKVVKDLNKARIIVEGHTDSKGSEAYNFKLSTERADSVSQWFKTKGGLAHVAIETLGRGESMPVASNQNADGSDNPEGRAKNRRVEIRIPE